MRQIRPDRPIVNRKGAKVLGTLIRGRILLQRSAAASMRRCGLVRNAAFIRQRRILSCAPLIPLQELVDGVRQHTLDFRSHIRGARLGFVTALLVGDGSADVPWRVIAVGCHRNE